MTSPEKNILMAAIVNYGEVSQINMMFEEMSELQKALCKWLRHEPLSDTDATSYALRTAICEEIADVEIMLYQMKLLFDHDGEVARVRQEKITRLRDRLNGMEAHNGT